MPPCRVAPKIPMSCSPEKTLLVGGLRGLGSLCCGNGRYVASCVAQVFQGLGYSPGEKELRARDPKGVPTLHTRSMCQREAMATHEEHEEQARGWGFGEGKTEQDRTGQELGQEERDVGDIDRRAGFRPLWLLMV